MLLTKLGMRNPVGGPHGMRHKSRGRHAEPNPMLADGTHSCILAMQSAWSAAPFVGFPKAAMLSSISSRPSIWKWPMLTLLFNTSHARASSAVSQARGLLAGQRG